MTIKTLIFIWCLIYFNNHLLSTNYTQSTLFPKACHTAILKKLHSFNNMETQKCLLPSNPEEPGEDFLERRHLNWILGSGWEFSGWRKSWAKTEAWNGAVFVQLETVWRGWSPKCGQGRVIARNEAKSGGLVPRHLGLWPKLMKCRWRADHSGNRG